MKEVRHITEHPVLGTLPEAGTVTFDYNGEPVTAREGDTVAAALTALGIRVFRHTRKRGEPRGVFCGIGHCNDCVMTVNGVPRVRTCLTAVEEGMVVESDT